MTESVAYPGGSARRQSIGEEVLNAISHGIGAVMAVIGTVLLVLRAKEEGDLLNIISVAIFGGSMILLYLISCLYHARSKEAGFECWTTVPFLLMWGLTPICLITVGARLG
ncbi:MAG: hemolysin III family protein [Evtepia gabavorous]